MPKNHSIVARALVIAATAVTLALGTAQLTAGTALAAVARPAATHWVTYASFPTEGECNTYGDIMVEQHIALDYICSQALECPTAWILDIELPGGDAANSMVAVKPAAAAC